MNDYRQAVEAFRRNVEILHGALLRERFGTTNVQSVVAVRRWPGALRNWARLPRGGHTPRTPSGWPRRSITPTVYLGVCGVGHFFLRQGALSQAIHVFERALALREAVNFPIFRRCHVGLGAAYALSGRVSEALPLLERGLEQSQPPGIMGLAPLFPVWLVRAMCWLAA